MDLNVFLLPRSLSSAFIIFWVVSIFLIDIFSQFSRRTFYDTLKSRKTNSSSVNILGFPPQRTHYKKFIEFLVINNQVNEENQVQSTIAMLFSVSARRSN